MTVDRDSSFGKLRTQARDGGLCFEAYLPPDLADWLLGLIEQGVYADSAEAVFVILGEHRNLARHPDLRQENLKRKLEAALTDTRPGISGEDMLAKLQERLAEPSSEPAVWPKG